MQTLRGLVYGAAVAGALALGTSAHAAGNLVGLWEFEDGGDLTNATIGNDLVLVGTDAAVGGSGGPDTGATQVGIGSHYTVTHGIAPNGGGTFVNEFSLLFDVSYPASSFGSWMTLYQTNTGNGNDGDGFINPTGNIGVGATGYTANATAAETWYRIVISVDNDAHYRYYVNGTLWLAGAVQSTDGRFSLDPFFHVLADENGDDATINLSNLAIWDGALSPNEAGDLGGAGRPIPEPASLALLGIGGLMMLKRRRSA